MDPALASCRRSVTEAGLTWRARGKALVGKVSLSQQPLFSPTVACPCHNGGRERRRWSE